MQERSRDFDRRPRRIWRASSNKGILLMGLLLALLGPGLSSWGASGTAEPADPNDKGAQAAEAQELSRKLEDLIGRLRQVRSDYYLRKAKDEAELDRARGNAQVLEADVEELRKQEADLDEQIQQHRTESSGLEKQLAEKSGIDEFVRGQVEPFCSAQKAAIEEGPAYKQQERIERLQAACLDSNDVNSVSAAETLGKVWSYAEEELRLARSSETYSGRIQMHDGTNPHVRYFRVGLLILGYVTEDGKRAGIWSALSDSKGWLHISDAKEGKQVRDAVDILDRRKGPSLLSLPVAIESTGTARGQR